MFATMFGGLHEGLLLATPPAQCSPIPRAKGKHHLACDSPHLADIVDLELVNSNVDATVNVAATAVAGDADSATVTVSGSALTSGLTVTYDGLETVNLVAAGTSGVRTATTNRSITIDSDQLETLIVTGAGDINVTANFVGAVADAQTATFDASDADGSVSATITKGASASVSVTMSAQDDFLDYTSALARQATLVGGQGTDTLHNWCRRRCHRWSWR